MAIAMTRPVICPSSVPITVTAVPVLVGGAPLTGKTLCSICHVQSSPGSRADQLMSKDDGLGAAACAKAASADRQRRAMARTNRSGLRGVMGGLQADGRAWGRAARTGNEKERRRTHEGAAVKIGRGERITARTLG